MSRSTHQRSLWQVIGLYAAGSWVVLQVIDVLTQNISLPPWVFTLTLTLLLIGLPITAATAYFQGIGRPSDGDADAEPAGSGAAVSSTGTRTDPSGLFTWGNVLKGGVATLAMWGIAVTGWMERSNDMQDHEIVYISCMTTSEGLRTHPRFQAILQRLDLPLPQAIE